MFRGSRLRVAVLGAAVFVLLIVAPSACALGWSTAQAAVVWMLWPSGQAPQIMSSRELPGGSWNKAQAVATLPSSHQLADGDPSLAFGSSGEAIGWEDIAPGSSGNPPVTAIDTASVTLGSWRMRLRELRYSSSRSTYWRIPPWRK